MSRVNTNFNAETSSQFQPSICIPRVFNNITEARIRHVFGELHLGNISRIDTIERKNEDGETFKRVFVHFDRWYDNPNSQSVRRKLIEGKEIKIVYDDPWFWKVSASKWTPSANVSQVKHPQQKPKAHIVFSDSPPRNRRDTDEFGRSLDLRRDRERERETRDYRPQLRLNYDERPQRRDDSRERGFRGYPQMEQRRAPQMDQRRHRGPINQHHRLPIAPTLSQSAPIAPTLPMPMPLPVYAPVLTPRSPSSSPPRQRVVAPVEEPEQKVCERSEAEYEDEDDEEENSYGPVKDVDEINEGPVVLDYSALENIPYPKRRRIVKKIEKKLAIVETN